MKFSLIDHNVSKTTNVFLVIANIINLVYNIPQIVKTCRSRSTKDFSGWFLSLRFLGNIIWIGYAIEVNSLLMLINNIVTVIASGIIGGFMINNMYKSYKIRKYNQIIETNNNTDTGIETVFDFPITVVDIEYNEKDNNNYNNNTNNNNNRKINNNDNLDNISLT
jgi:uncharacterized protein with PQ loop repeat